MDIAVKRYGGGQGSAASLYRLRAIHQADPALYDTIKGGTRSITGAYLDLVRRHLLPPARKSAAHLARRKPGSHVRLPQAGDQVPVYMRLVDADLAHHIAVGVVTPEVLAAPLLLPQPDHEGLDELLTIRDAYDMAVQIVERDLGIIDSPVVVETVDPRPTPAPSRRRLDVEWVLQQQAYVNGETESIDQMVARINSLGPDKSTMLMILQNLAGILAAVLDGIGAGP